MKKRLLAWMLVIALAAGEGSAAYAGEIEEAGEAVEQMDGDEKVETELSEEDGLEEDEQDISEEDFGLPHENKPGVAANEDDYVFKDNDGSINSEVRNKALESEIAENQNGSGADTLDDTLPAQNEVDNKDLFTGGIGTIDNPYQISTAEEFNNVRSDLSACYILVNDIDLSIYDNWKPIGTYASPFIGNFDGNNHAIVGLTITDTEIDKQYMSGAECTALFGYGGKEYVNETIIKNLSLKEVSININNKEDLIRVGTISSGGYSIISNCNVDGEIHISNCHDIYVGGITCMGGSVQSCTSNITMYVESNKVDDGNKHGDIVCGGISGMYGNITDSFNYGEITAISGNFLRCGGICGERASISHCVNYGNIFGQTVYHESDQNGGYNCEIGGISGSNGGNIDRCLNYGDIEESNPKGSTCSVGGIAGGGGYMNWTSSINNCFNMGSKINSSNSCAHRIGSARQLTKCYSLDSTLVDGAVPLDDLGSSKSNGESIDFDSMMYAIANNFEAVISVTKIVGKGEHYLSGQTNYETLSDLEKLDNGYSVLKGSTWNVTKTADLSDGTLYIRQDATVKVSGNLRAGEIIVEKGGTLQVASGGKVTAASVTAKGGWAGDSWFGGNDSSGGKVEVNGGLLVTDNLNFEGRSTLHINNSGKAVARNTMRMVTSSNGSSLEKGYVFIGGKLIVKNKNYLASSSGFGTVFYGNETAEVLKASGKEFSLGMVYVVNPDVFMNLGIESKNYAGAAKCKVAENTWNITGISKIADADTSLSWAANTETAFTKMASSQSAFVCTNSQLTGEEREFVEELAAVWVTVLQAPICDGLLEFESADCTLDFQLDKGKKKCVLRLMGTNFGGYGKLASVSLSVNGSAETTIGEVASASVDEFSKKAQEYLQESMNKEFISYASGMAAGIVSSKTGISKDIVKKFIEKITKKVCVNEKIFNKTSTSSTTELSNRFKITEMLIKSSAKTSSAYSSVDASMGLEDVFNEEFVIEAMPETAALSEVSGTVTDGWLKQRLIEILGEDADGEPDFSKAETVTQLDLSEGYIRKLDGLQYFTNLKELNIADNEVQDLSPIAGLTKLEKLDVSDQFISNLSPISELANLTVLDISDNELTSLSSIVRLIALKELNVSGNRLTTLSSIAQLSGMEKLRVSNNPLTSENLAALKNLSRLSTLEANNCGLNSAEGLPLDNLTECYLSDNNIESLSALSGAKNLSILDVSYNLLGSAEELSGITTLTKLDISRNQLDSCESLQKLTNLVSLYLAQTGMIDTDLDMLADLKKLEILDISDNLIFGLSWRDSLDALNTITVSNTALDDYDINRLRETGLTVINHSAPIILKSISFLNSDVTLRRGNLYLQEVCCYPTDAPLDGLAWSSSDETVAMVNEDGVVTALASGQAVITAETADKEIAASFALEVKGGNKGDINVDGKITMTDLLICLHHVSGRTALTGDAFLAADINDDGEVKMTDLMRILHYVSGRNIAL